MESEAQKLQSQGYRVPKIITKKQRDFLVSWEATGFDPSKLKDCLRKAQYAESTVKTSGRHVRKALGGILVERMDAAGLGVDAIVKEHKRLALDSMHPKYQESPDNAIRLNAIKEAYTLRDLYPAKKLDIDQHQRSEHYVSIETIRRAEKHSGERVIDVEPEPEDGRDTDRFIRPL